MSPVPALETILEAMAEGVLVTDGHGAVLVANRALREMFLVGRDVIGRTPLEAVNNPDLHAAIVEATRTRAPVSREVAVEGLRPRRVMVRIAPLDDGTGASLAVLTDVTDLRRLETIRRDFVANVSHELRTPIAAVRAAVETLLDGAMAQPDAAKEFLTIVDRQAFRLHQLVEDLLELSRIEAKELKLVLEPVELGSAVAHALELFGLAAEKEHIRLAALCPADAPRVWADRRAVEQIVSNLVDNAIKYSPERSTVTVRVGAQADRVRVSVEDTGPGIEAQHLPRLFERFYRVDPGRSRQVGGTGLGLAIVKHLTEALGGTVAVESTMGRGARFDVDLRRCEPSDVDSVPPAAPG